MARMVRIPLSNRIWYVVPEFQWGDLVRVETDRVDGDGSTHLFVQRHLLTDVGRSRSTDPSTSKAAAAAQSVHKVRTEHRVILDLLQWESMTDFELAKRASQALGRPVKQTSIGVRRGELVRLGLVADSGRKGKSDTGTACIIWQITMSGRQTVAA
jgi:hypothetical protein